MPFCRRFLAQALTGRLGKIEEAKTDIGLGLAEARKQGRAPATRSP